MSASSHSVLSQSGHKVSVPSSHSVLSQTGHQVSVLVQADQPLPIEASKPHQMARANSQLRFDEDVTLKVARPKPLMRAASRLSFEDINQERLARRKQERGNHESHEAEDGNGTFLKKSTREKLLANTKQAAVLQSVTGSGDDSLAPAMTLKLRRWQRKAYFSASYFRQLVDCLSRVGDRICDGFNVIISILLSILFLLVDEGVFEIFLKAKIGSNPRSGHSANLSFQSHTRSLTLTASASLPLTSFSTSPLLSPLATPCPLSYNPPLSARCRLVVVPIYAGVLYVRHLLHEHRHAERHAAAVAAAAAVAGGEGAPVVSAWWEQELHAPPAPPTMPFWVEDTIDRSFDVALSHPILFLVTVFGTALAIGIFFLFLKDISELAQNLKHAAARRQAARKAEAWQGKYQQLDADGLEAGLGREASRDELVHELAELKVQAEMLQVYHMACYGTTWRTVAWRAIGLAHCQMRWSCRAFSVGPVMVLCASGAARSQVRDGRRGGAEDAADGYRGAYQ